MPITPISDLADEIEAFMEEGLPRVDPRSGKLYLTNGNVLQTQKFSSLRLMRLYNSEEGKPQRPTPPMAPVTYAGGLTREEPNPDDPDYQTAMAIWEVEEEAWNSQKQERIMIYVFTSGVQVTVPEVFIEEASVLSPGARPLLVRYEYICSLIPDEDLEFVLEALTGRTVATDKGVEEANTFLPSNGKRSGHSGVSSAQGVGEDQSLYPIRVAEGADPVRPVTRRL